VVTSLTHAVNAASTRSMPFDLEKDFTPVAMLGASPFVVVVHPSMPATLADLLALARSSSEPITVSTGGIGSSVHLIAELFAQTAGINIRTIPYKGSGPALVDLVAGQVQMSFSSVVSTLPYISTKQLRGLAVTSLNRNVSLPDLPTLDESGFKGFEGSSWIALYAPAGTPPEIVDKLNAEISASLDAPAVKKALETDGSDIIKISPAELGRYVSSEIAKWRDVMQKADIVLE
jgi:tripartite-type tricarboxylate transporter receptor subunit TctC